MSLTSPLTEFCKKRGIDGQTKSAFGAFIRATYADKFGMKESGETVHVLLNRLSEEDLEAAWLDFINTLAKYLTG